MPLFVGQSINFNIQEALDDAVRQARVVQADQEHHAVQQVEVRRIFSVREGQGSFSKLYVEIDAK